MTTDVFPSGTDGHPEVDEISALTEGLLAPEPTERLHGHLETCPLCADVRASLEEIRGVLGTLPGPTPMPGEVAGRIDAALAAEALLDATAPASSGGRVSRETTPTARARSAVSRETTATTAPPGRSTAATGPGRRRSRGRRRTAFFTAACAVVALGLGGLLTQKMLTDDPADPGGDPQTSAQDAQLERHVHHLLTATVRAPSGAKRGSSAPAQGGGQAPSGPMPLEGGGVTSVPTCVRQGIHRSQTPLAVDERTSYRGRSAYLVVLPHSGDPRRVDVYLVDPSCTTGAVHGPGEVLLTRTYSRS